MSTTVHDNGTVYILKTQDNQPYLELKDEMVTEATHSSLNGLN